MSHGKANLRSCLVERVGLLLGGNENPTLNECGECRSQVYGCCWQWVSSTEKIIGINGISFEKTWGFFNGL